MNAVNLAVAVSAYAAVSSHCTRDCRDSDRCRYVAALLYIQRKPINARRPALKLTGLKDIRHICIYAFKENANLVTVAHAVLVRMLEPRVAPNKEGQALLIG